MVLVDTKVMIKYKDGGVRMEKIPKGLYTKEFKEEAVKMVTEGGLSIPEVGRRLSIAKSTIAYWVGLAKEGALAGSGRQQRLVACVYPFPKCSAERNLSACL